MKFALSPHFVTSGALPSSRRIVGAHASLKDMWRQSLCQDTTRSRLGGGSKFSDLKASSTLSRRDEAFSADAD